MNCFKGQFQSLSLTLLFLIPKEVKVAENHDFLGRISCGSVALVFVGQGPRFAL